MSKTDSTHWRIPVEFPEPGGLVFAVRADQVRAEVIGDECFELAADEALVADDHLPWLKQMPVVVEHHFGDFAFSNFRVRESPDHGHPVWGAEQVETESPEVAGMGGAVPVACVPGEVGAVSPSHATSRTAAGSYAFAPPGPAGQVREHVFQVRAGIPDPFAIRGDSEQVLRDQQTQRLNIIERGLTGPDEDPC